MNPAPPKPLLWPLTSPLPYPLFQTPAPLNLAIDMGLSFTRFVLTLTLDRDSLPTSPCSQPSTLLSPATHPILNPYPHSDPHWDLCSGLTFAFTVTLSLTLTLTFKVRSGSRTNLEYPVDGVGGGSVVQM